MTQALRTLLIVRSHKADAETLAAYDRFAALGTMDVLLCCDERAGVVDPGGREKAFYNLETLREMGLFAHPACGWRCGDYAYYAARAARPDYDVYWMIEPDVVIHTADLRATFDALNHGDADLIAARLAPRGPRWGWHRTMCARYSSVHGCIFPVTRLSGRAIDHLYQARRAALVPLSEDAEIAWPNDEVFVATELMNHGFVCRDIGEQRAQLYTRDSLRTGLPHDRAKLLAQPPDEMIHHPVRDLTAWLDARSDAVSDYARRNATRPPSAGQVRALLDFAKASLEHEDLADAALLPLLLLARHPDAPTALPPDLAPKQVRAHVLLRRHFSAPPDRALAFGHTVTGLAARLDAVPSPADFLRGAPVPLRRVPPAYVLPYGFDFEAETMLATLHARPGAVLQADGLLDAQRGAGAICVIPWASLPRLGLSPPAGRRLRVTVGEVAGSENTLRHPPALTQLAARRDIFRALPAARQRLLLRVAVLVSAGDAWLVASEEEAALIGEFARYLPELGV